MIPMSKQGMFEYDIDVPENILSMCPTCHRKVHLAKDNVKKKILFEAFKNRENMLMKRGIVLDINIILFVGEVMFTLSQCSLALVKRSTFVSHLLVMLVSCEN